MTTTATDRQPVLYLSHGAPPLADDARWTAELAAWSTDLPRPASVLIIPSESARSRLTLAQVRCALHDGPSDPGWRGSPRPFTMACVGSCMRGAHRRAYARTRWGDSTYGLSGPRGVVTSIKSVPRRDRARRA